MKNAVYEEIVKAFKNYKGLPKNCSTLLCQRFPSIDPNAVYSIVGQQVQQKMKATYYQVLGADKCYYDFYRAAVQRKESPGILLRMAVELNTCPALLGRKILEEYCEVEKDPSQANLGRLLKDTTLIKDKDLAYEMYLCILYDTDYGAFATAISQSVGEEYEMKLENYLIKANIPYLNETDLRQKGYDKTPDCKLEVPIAVNGFVVNWIESKAQFGSPIMHNKYIKEQFLSYWNRFGPGLVIYWFGFVDKIVHSNETRFIMLDNFPENITYMDPSSIK